MGQSRLIALVCAVLAAVLVIIAGKSCTDSVIEQKKEGGKSSAAVLDDLGAADNVKPSVEDPYGRGSIPADEPDSTEPGTLIEAETEIATDEFGNETVVIRQREEAATEAPTETTTLSDFEQFLEDQKKPPSEISGFYHGEVYQESATEAKHNTTYPTISDDFVLEIG